VRKDGRGTGSLLDAADHLSLLLPPIRRPSLPSSLLSSTKSQRALSARSHSFLYVSFFLFFFLLRWRSLSGLVVTFGRRPVVYPPSVPFPPSGTPIPRSPAMDSHYSLQVPNSGGSSRGTSRPVSVQPASSTSQPQSARKRASHTVQSSQQQSHQVSDDNLPTYRDVYSHPAAVAYAAAHPRRTIPKFGPYLLLQTLGEGEFGKVKLGLHMQWGEEVAVKLIRRGNIDTSARMSKVEREIEVLRVRFCSPLCHLFSSLFGPAETLSGGFCLLGSQTS